MLIGVHTLHLRGEDKKMSADAAAEDDDEAATPVGEVDTSAEVVREGFLTKQSTGKSKLLMRNWRKRWFVLRANCKP